MMAPDYAWWHGFYELKHRFVHVQQMAAELKEGKGKYMHVPFPGRME